MMFQMRLKNILCLLQNRRVYSLNNYCSFSSNIGIEVPNRIHRGPTDVLKALSNAIQRDLTAPHYKYHDDPYLIPHSNYTKRSYALSQEAGRKAAQWIRQQHPDLFEHRVAEPIIEGYLPKPQYTEESEISEDILLSIIKNGLPSDAITVYNLLTNKGTELSSSTKESLLELLSYFNCEDPISEEWTEERWFRTNTKVEISKKTWKDDGLPEQLFNELKKTDPLSYSAIITAMCRFSQIEKAVQIYEEAQENLVALSVQAYNSLLSKVYLMKENHEKMWQVIMSFLNDMKERKVRPNLRTLNSILETLSKMNTNKNAKISALQILAEFKALGIEPSLATFYYLFELFIKDKSKLGSIMAEILNYTQNKKYDILDPSDILFFLRAMEICSFHLHNKELAHSLHKFLLTENNYNLIGDSYRESLYYRNYFFLLCDTETLTNVMEFYDDIVPNVYVPEPAVINALITAVNTNSAWNLLPRLWSDIKLFDQAEISGVLENILECASNNGDAALQEEMTKIAWDVWNKVEGLKRERSNLEYEIVQLLIQGLDATILFSSTIASRWTGSMLGNILLILLHGNEKAKSHLVMDKLVRLGSNIMNEPKLEVMQLYIDECIESSSPDLAIKCIQYCDNLGFIETAKFARHLNSSINLTDLQRNKLASIVGEGALKLKESEIKN